MLFASAFCEHFTNESCVAFLSLISEALSNLAKSFRA